jgi:hypothetical protein
MPTDEPTPYAFLKAIRMRLSTPHAHESAEARRESALGALAAALLVIQNGSSHAWALQEVPGESLAYDIAPLSEQPLPASDAWMMAYALRGQPQVAAAEPLFADSGGGRGDERVF